jgi:hypothetical protein
VSARRRERRWVAAVCAAAGACAACGAALAEDALSTIDRFVPHVSTVPANAGQKVGLFVREKLGAELQSRIAAGTAPEGRVVLFVHGVSVSSVPDFDLQFKDYSWMAYLASAGFDTFAWITRLRVLADAEDGQPVQHERGRSRRPRAESAREGARPNTHISSRVARPTGTRSIPSSITSGSSAVSSA